ncbi:unnamed protein product [Symbiodinium sp. CCMP2592]|nr:unnamed protein product [Symbiodinium sp. CCMP2592]
MKAEKVKSEVAKMSEEDRAEWRIAAGTAAAMTWPGGPDSRELDKPTSQTKTVNGEVLLRVWTGLEDRDGSRHSITAGLKQRCDLHNSEDLEAFGTQADMRLQRGETLLRADRMSSDAAGVHRETPLLQIQADMEASSKMRMAAEQQLYEEAEKIEEKRRQLLSQRPKVSSAALEKLQYESSISRARSSCEASLCRFKTALKTLKLEIEQMSENNPTTMAEMKTRTDKFEEIYKGAEQYLEETIEKWTTALESNPSDTSDEAAEKWHQYFMDVSAFVKTFASRDAVKKVKDNLTDIRAWCAEYKKGCNKKKRLSVSSANKAAKSQKTGNLPPGSNSPLGEALSNLFWTQAVENIDEDQGVVFAAADWVKKENQAFALVLAAAQNQQLLQEWLELPYYEQQKTWLAESWKKGSGPELSTNVVAKPQLCTKLNKDWMSCLGNASKHIKDVTTDGDLKEVFSPMFWSMGKNTSKIYFTTDYALTEFKMCLEGTSVCCGFQINTTMMKDGWIVHLSPGKALGIPAGHCYCQMAQDVTHGCRVLKLRASDEKSPVGLLTARIADYPELIGLRTGRIPRDLFLADVPSDSNVSAAALYFFQKHPVHREDLWGANAAFICSNSPQQVPVADLGNFDVLLKVPGADLGNLYFAECVDLTLLFSANSETNHSGM